jgi:hypothetical protein
MIEAGSSMLRKGLEAFVDGREAPPSFGGRVLGIFRTSLPLGNSTSAPVALFAVSPYWALVSAHYEGFVFEMRIDKVEDILAAVGKRTGKAVQRDLDAMASVDVLTPAVAFGRRDPESMWHKALAYEEGRGFHVSLPPFRDADARLDVTVSVLEMVSDHTVRIPGKPSGVEWSPYVEPRLEAYSQDKSKRAVLTIAVPDRKAFDTLLTSGWAWRIEPCSALYGS